MLFSIAPMLDWSYQHFRILMRILAPNSLIYTEMLHPFAILKNPEKFLKLTKIESSIALQLGGSDTDALIQAAILGQRYSMTEINLNLGCPSQKVQSGNFGACLMLEADLVSSIVTKLVESLSIPVSIKTRIGVDNNDSYDFFATFIYKLYQAQCRKFIIHARKAWLSGLSPKQNRSIPPINYDYVYKIQKEFPDCDFIINGEIKSYEEIKNHLTKVKGVMIGRLAYENPYAIHKIHNQMYILPDISRAQILEKYLEYANPLPLSFFLKPIYSLAHNLDNAICWKQELNNIQKNQDVSLINKLPKLMKDLENQ